MRRHEQQSLDEEDVAVWKESRGECWGMPCFESVCGCPECGGDFTETYRCSSCDEWIEGKYIKLENDERICENCYTTYELGEEN